MRSSPSIADFRLNMDLTKFRIAVLLLRARRNRLEDMRPLVPELLQKLAEAKSGALTVIGN